jgi:GAF domain-containing protein/anti-sigma regulatory factor (Ser/Thr protein kinase)
VTDASNAPADLALEQLRRLESITDVALAHVTLDQMLPALLDRVHEALEVDTVAVLLLDEETDELVARAAKGIEEEVERGVRIPLGKGFAGRIAGQRRPIFLPDVATGGVLNPILIEKGICSLLGVPLITEGKVVGVMHVGSLVPREFGAEETRLLELAASRAAPAIEHARLYEAERDARQRAEDAVRELRALQELSDAALAHLDLDEMLTEVLERLRGALGADTAAVLLLDPESDELVARAARGLEEEVERGVRIPVGGGFAGRIAAERRLVEIPDIDQADVLNPILRERGIKSLLGAPMIAAGEVRGVVHVGTLRPHRFRPTEARLLQLAADRIAMALDHSRLLHERDAAIMLQQSLLPERLPEVAGLTLAARYRPGRGGMVGGDWYDALPLPNGGVGLAMGDVVSRGVRAATVMGQLRHALRTFAIEGDPPGRVVQRLAELVRSLDRREMVTLAYVVLDADARRLEYVSAGHLPPLVVDHDGSRFLEGARGAPLGALPYPRYDSATVELAPDSLIVLCTDGLVERRDRPITDGMSQMAAIATATGPDPDQICGELVYQLVNEDSTDDVAVVVARTVAQAADRFEVRLPAVSGSLAPLRRALRQWLAENDATADDILEVVIAVGEAAGNAVEHAYGPGDATFDVTGSIDAGILELHIRDYGNWRPPRGQNRGRGTLLMQELMDDFEVMTTGGGTEVVLRRRLGQVRQA